MGRTRRKPKETQPVNSEASHKFDWHAWNDEIMKNKYLDKWIPRVDNVKIFKLLFGLFTTGPTPGLNSSAVIIYAASTLRWKNNCHKEPVVLPVYGQFSHDKEQPLPHPKDFIDIVKEFENSLPVENPIDILTGMEAGKYQRIFTDGFLAPADKTELVTLLTLSYNRMIIALTHAENTWKEAVKDIKSGKITMEDLGLHGPYSENLENYYDATAMLYSLHILCLMLIRLAAKSVDSVYTPLTFGIYVRLALKNCPYASKKNIFRIAPHKSWVSQFAVSLQAEHDFISKFIASLAEICIKYDTPDSSPIVVEAATKKEAIAKAREQQLKPPEFHRSLAGFLNEGLLQHIVYTGLTPLQIIDKLSDNFKMHPVEILNLVFPKKPKVTFDIFQIYQDYYRTKVEQKNKNQFEVRLPQYSFKYCRVIDPLAFSQIKNIECLRVSYCLASVIDGAMNTKFLHKHTVQKMKDWELDDENISNAIMVLTHKSTIQKIKKPK